MRLYAAVILLGFSLTAPAQVTAQEIDRDLADQVDLRDLDFRVCFETHSCSVNGVTIAGFIRESSDDPWMPGLLYWDPVDGIGVLGGGQDDEIDFNEHVTIRFDSEREIDTIWLTDLFTSEFDRYTHELQPETFLDDVEYAEIRFDPDAASAEVLRVTGIAELPIDSFNESLNEEIFTDGGDIHYRMIVSEDTAYILEYEVGSGLREFSSFELGEVEQAKLDLFQDVGVEFVYDLAEVFPDRAAINLYPNAAVNAERVREMLERPAMLEQLEQEAQIRRRVGDVDNGEVAVDFESPRGVTTLRFSSLPGTSNDYSIAGFVITRPEGS